MSYLNSLELLALSTMTNVHSVHAKTAKNPFGMRSTTATQNSTFEFLKY